MVKCKHQVGNVVQQGASKMTTKTIEISDMSDQLNELLSLALQGTEIIFAQEDTPLARLTLIAPSVPKPRIAGLHKGSIWVSDDFDEPLPDDFWLGTA
jgi:antitoxin (DNA-binding transcriptional repressor) of toxin-antitoxin stability system